MDFLEVHAMRKHDHIPISFLAIPFVFSALPNVLNAQILVQDTLLLTFPDAGFVAPVVMDSVIDKRGQDAHVLGTYEKK